MYAGAVTGSPPSLAQVRSIRYIRRIAAVCIATMIGGAACLIYVLGFTVHPHRVGFAVIFTVIYVVVVMGGGYSLIYRAQIARARRL
jgi:lysylphosphatidylglycerol synthetase-like protein (DUF2156 family)